ncbi:hypothetical protein CTI12_AA036400 [Artemisia annua]|uniref:BED-type domain-containing protein n=1 Tax=Artemisia annua TaxID=35608 RepID=A0A2U1PFH6_ARTAN|nr:hypothetical protein CTI12_AA036400 [Artemisia annua]
MESNPSISSTRNNNKDPGRNYGIQDPKIKNNFTCKFCSKVTKGGVSRLKQHLVGGFSAVTVCPDCPEHVRDELRSYMDAKDRMKVTMQMSTDQLHDDGDDLEELAPNTDFEDSVNRELVAYETAIGHFGRAVAIRQRKQMAPEPTRFTRSTIHCDVGSSKNNKGKGPAQTHVSSRPSKPLVLEDEDDMEEDIGVSNNEVDEPVLEFDDDDFGDY